LSVLIPLKLNCDAPGCHVHQQVDLLLEAIGDSGTLTVACWAIFFVPGHHRVIARCARHPTTLAEVVAELDDKAHHGRPAANEKPLR